MKILYFVNHGPDRSHLWDAMSFPRLKDALVYVNNLPVTPTGDPRPYRVERFEYSGSAIWGDVVRTKVLASRA